MLDEKSWEIMLEAFNSVDYLSLGTAHWTTDKKDQQMGVGHEQWEYNQMGHGTWVKKTDRNNKVSQRIRKMCWIHVSAW